MTALNENRKFLMIHIPKTGGTSMVVVLDCLTNRFDWHAPAKVVKAGLEDFDQYFRFAFVRNPWARMWSLYQHMKKYPEWGDFNDWLTTYDDSDDRKARHDHRNVLMGQTAPWDDPMSSTRKPQLYYITDDDGELLVDFVGRYENIGQDFATVCDRIDLGGLTLPHERKSSDRRPYQEVYNESGIAHVRKYFAPDIEYGSYRF